MSWVSGVDWSALGSVAVAVVLLAGIAAAVGALGGLRQGRDVVTAVARAVVQIAAVGLVLGVVLRTPALAPLYLAAALAVASWTSARRLGAVWARTSLWPLTALAIGAGAVSSAVVVVAVGALEPRALQVVPFTAQLVGGCMSATTLAGRRMLDDVESGWAEVEGWLAIGARPAQAVAPLGRTAASRALAPALDQTRTVGLVTLPGAFVGLLLGGASPWEAARVQLLVLVGLLAAETVAAVVVTRGLGRRVRTKPGRGSS